MAVTGCCCFAANLACKSSTFVFTVFNAAISFSMSLVVDFCCFCCCCWRLSAGIAVLTVSGVCAGDNRFGVQFALASCSSYSWAKRAASSMFRGHISCTRSINRLSPKARINASRSIRINMGVFNCFSMGYAHSANCSIASRSSGMVSFFCRVRCRSLTSFVPVLAPFPKKSRSTPTNLL